MANMEERLEAIVTQAETDSSNGTPLSTVMKIARLKPKMAMYRLSPNN